MKSESNQDIGGEKQEISQFGRLQPFEIALTPDQYTMIQHYLPKGYAFLEKKSGKRDKGSNHKFIDNENLSRFSGGFDNNTEDDPGRSKRNRMKKIDRFLEDQTPRVVKRAPTEKVEKFTLDDDINQCTKILNLLKKHQNSFPFLEAVDPERSGASNYFEVIKQPMDFSKIERKLKSGQYQVSSQFHADVSKIWENSYLYNDKTSKIYKITVELERYYRRLIEDGPRRKTGSKEKAKNTGKAHLQEKVSILSKSNDRNDDAREHEQRSSVNQEQSINQNSNNDDLDF